MIITFLAWLYITILCWIWGSLIFHCLNKFLKNTEPVRVYFSITCFLGLAGITVFSSFLSLFMPLGGWLTQLLIISPCVLAFFLKSFQNSFLHPKNDFAGMHIIFILMFCVCAVLLLAMSTWYIKNEDTLDYHTQIIQWIEKYKAVPGVVHLHKRYGLQSSWFISCAIFSFSFLKTNAITFINSTVILWYLFFVTSQINICFADKKKRIYALLWLTLLLFNLWSYTQIRLAITTASPDFITTLYIWLIFFLLLNDETKKPTAINLTLIIILSFFAFTIKLSAAPIMILSVYGIFRLIAFKKIRGVIVCGFISIIILAPFAARNIISSGYVFFPSVFPDIANVDWKLNKKEVIHIHDYITSYAKIKADAATDKIEKSVSTKSSDWIITWWKNQSLADQSILLLSFFSFLWFCWMIKKIRLSDQRIKISMLTAFTGIVFWFVLAPDPRFGFGFIIAFPALIINNWLPLKISISKKMLLSVTLVTSLFISAYFIYRTIYFFSPKQIVSPMGIEKIPYSTFQCNGIDFKIPESGNPCGTTAVPCTYNTCEKFEPRGNKITDGFRGR